MPQGFVRVALAATLSLRPFGIYMTFLQNHLTISFFTFALSTVPKENLAISLGTPALSKVLSAMVFRPSVALSSRLIIFFLFSSFQPDGSPCHIDGMCIQGRCIINGQSVDRPAKSYLDVAKRTLEQNGVDVSKILPQPEPEPQPQLPVKEEKVEIEDPIM
jgi:hypothetical protein